MTQTEPDVLVDLALLAAPSRQSPIAIGHWILTRIRRIGLVNLVVGAGVLLSRALPVWALLLVPVVGLAIIAGGVAAWWRFTFRATADSVVVSRGVLSRHSLVIPFDKVQSVTVDEDLLERVFGLVSASIDTAGAAGPEFAIRGIDRAQAEALRRLASEGRSSPVDRGAPDSPPDPVDEDQVVLARRSPQELLVIGMLANPLGGLAVFTTLMFFADDLLGLFGIDLPPAEEIWVSVLRRISLVTIAGLVVLLVVSWAGYGLRTVIRDWDLRLTSDRDGIALAAGLLKRRSRSSHVNKIQSIQVAHGPLLRWVGFVQLTLQTIGQGDLVVPGVTAAELDRVRERLDTPFPARPERTISAHLAYYWARIGAYLAVLLALPVGLADWRFLPACLLLPLVAGLKGYLFVRRFRWELGPDVVSRRSGKLATREEGMRVSKVQSVRLDQSYYQRRRGLATVSISNAESEMEIPMIGLSDARAVRDRLLAPPSPA